MAAFADFFLAVMPPFVHRYSRAAFADYFLPVMPPLVHHGGICGLFKPVMPPFVHSRAAFTDFFSTSNAAIHTQIQQGGICGLFSTSNAAICTEIQQGGILIASSILYFRIFTLMH